MRQQNEAAAASLLPSGSQSHSHISPSMQSFTLPMRLFATVPTGTRSQVGEDISQAAARRPVRTTAHRVFRSEVPLHGAPSHPHANCAEATHHEVLRRRAVNRGTQILNKSQIPNSYSPSCSPVCDARIGRQCALNSKCSCSPLQHSTTNANVPDTCGDMCVCVCLRGLISL